MRQSAVTAMLLPAGAERLEFGTQWLWQVGFPPVTVCNVDTFIANSGESACMAAVAKLPPKIKPCIVNLM